VRPKFREEKPEGLRRELEAAIVKKWLTSEIFLNRVQTRRRPRTSALDIEHAAVAVALQLKERVRMVEGRATVLERERLSGAIRRRPAATEHDAYDDAGISIANGSKVTVECWHRRLDHLRGDLDLDLSLVLRRDERPLFRQSIVEQAEKGARCGDAGDDAGGPRKRPMRRRKPAPSYTIMGRQRELNIKAGCVGDSHALGA
jgi:hypothetical protein